MSSVDADFDGAIAGRAAAAGAVTLYLDVREGPVPATIPAEIVERLAAAGDETRLDHALAVAAIVIVRLGREGGEALLTHWLDHDPRIVLHADPQFVRTLAWQPELLTGPLAGSGE
jgi:hypothetical protein